MKDKLIYAAVILALITPFLLFFLTSWYYALIIGNIIYSVICGYYIRISDKEYSTTKSIIIPLIFNFLGFSYIIIKIQKAKDKYRDIPREAEEFLSLFEKKYPDKKDIADGARDIIRQKNKDRNVEQILESLNLTKEKKHLDQLKKDVEKINKTKNPKDSINMDFSKDPDKYLKFEKFKESVKSLLDSKEHIWISVIPYKYDTIEKEITEGDNLWEGIKYSGSWDVIAKRATFHFDIERESINDFYNIIKKYKSLDELKGDDFNLVPLENDGGHRENIKIDWERPLTEKELKAFEEYGGKEELASVSERQTDDILVGRISAIEISVGKERSDYGEVIGKKEIIKIEID